MGIYLPNMEMPQKGQMLVIFPDGTSYVCFNGMRERLTQTTAFPIPPHGDLIDRMAFRYEMDNHYPFDKFSQGKHGIEDGIKSEILYLLYHAPTIIEAEGEEWLI